MNDGTQAQMQAAVDDPDVLILAPPISLGWGRKCNVD
jgi:hypothetical protein